MHRHRATRHVAWAFFGSLLLHAVCGMVIVSRSSLPKTVALQHKVTPMAVRWFEAPTQTPSNRLKAPEQREPLVRRVPQRKAVEVVKAKPAAASSAQNGAHVTVELAPPLLVQWPSLIDRAPTAGPTHGVTLHNTGALPDQRVINAATEAHVTQLVDSAIHAAMAEARARSSTNDPEYSLMREHLREATKSVPAWVNTESPRAVLGALVDGWQADAERYGKTGSAYEEPTGRAASLESPSAIAQSAGGGAPEAQKFLQFLSSGARLQEFADGSAGLELFALVEISQRATGELAAVTLMRTSGMRDFDTWVVDRAHEVALRFVLDGSARTRPLRSLWRFDGHIIYRRKISLAAMNGRAALGAIATSVLGAITNGRVPIGGGRFDEMTGALDIIDLSNPSYRCEVTLLEAD